MIFLRPDGISHFSHVPNSCAALAPAYVASDSRIWAQLFPLGSEKIGGTVADDYFEKLLQEPGCEQAWEVYTNTTATEGFPYRLGRGTISLNGFRHYWIQDALYLEYYVRVRLGAIGAANGTVSTKEIQKFTDSVKPGLDCAAGARDDCEKRLGVPLTCIDSEKESAKLKACIEHCMKVVNGEFGGDTPWVDIHFALLPCIKGYYHIATSLLKDPEVVKNTLYYSMWIEANADPYYVNEYDAFLQATTKKATDGDWKRWGKIFKTACDNERRFFELATNDYKELESPYHVLKPGCYTISPYGDDVRFLDVDSGVVTLTTNNAKWELKTHVDGYTIENVTAGASLSVSTKDSDVPCYHVQTGGTVQKWAINTVQVYDAHGDPIRGYQLFAPDTLAFVLGWNSADPNVFASNNYQGTRQTWMIKPAN